MSPFHTVIIGAGPGGIKAAEVLARAKKKVGLVSQDLGGECLNYGCIPTKTYLWTADLWEKINQSSIFGIETESAKISWKRMKERKIEVVSKLKRNLQQSLQRLGVEIFEGTGGLEDAHTLSVKGPQWNQRLQAENIILATGSEAVFPPGFLRSEKILSNREILDLPEIPKTLLVLGGGAVGVEFASLFAELGTQVTIAETSERILPNEDHEISAELERIFLRKKITILRNTRIAPEQTKNFERVLVAVGRKPILSAFAPALEKIGVRFNEKNLETNEYLQTNITHIFAIGDLAGKAMLAYSAEREAKIAAETILGKNPKPLQYGIVPNTIFCIPEVASVGLTEEEIQKRAIPYVTGKSLVSANSKALILARRDGFAKILVDRTNYQILGIHLIGEKTTELIAEASLALSLSLNLPTFMQNIHSHPILGEIINASGEDALYKLQEN